MTLDATASDLVLLAARACRLTLPSIPEAIQAQARLCILDTIACIVSGTRAGEARMVLACEPGAEDTAQVTIFGTAQRRPLLGGIRINGYLGDVLELNDLIGGHASIGNVTASLALAETRGASTGALVEAVVRGIEVTSRVYGAVYPSLKRFTDTGLVPVGIPSSIGVAAAASRLLELDAERTAHAMAIAGALAGWCPAEVIFGDGGTLKPMLFGAQPGVTGVTAALYAQGGMTGPLRLLESKLGYFATAATAARLDTGPWTDAWALAQPRRKLHACCGYLHSAVDATVQLRRRVPDASSQGSLEIHVPAYTADAVGKPAPPVSANDARFHLQYCVALAWCGADVIAPDHSLAFGTYLSRPEVAGTMGRIRVVVDPALTHYQQCKVVLRGDTHDIALEQALDAPRGSPGEPLTESDVIDKFMRLTAPVLPRAHAEQVVGALTAPAPAAPATDWVRQLAL